MYREGIRLFEQLVEKKQCYQEAIKVVETAVKSQTMPTREVAIKLFATVVASIEEADHAKAIEAVKLAMLSEDEMGLKFYGLCVTHGFGYDQAIVEAEKAILREEWHIREAGLGLYRKLLKQGRGRASAKQAVEAAAPVITRTFVK